MSSSALTELEEIQRATKEREDIFAKYDKGREEGAQIDPWEDPAYEYYHVTDRYGFIHDQPLPAVPGTVEEKQKAVEIKRHQKWVKMTKDWDKYFPGEKMARRVYKGIPERLRWKVWSRFLSVEKVRNEQEGVYKKMCERARYRSTFIRQIDMDINRTYRNHTMFRERYNAGQKALFNVLGAYSVYNTEVGYCQGMSEIAALLLMYFEEEDAFWGLSQLFVSEKHTLHGFFKPGFPKLMRFQEHHDNVLKKFLPKLRRHFERNEIYTSFYTIKWFLQCFLDRTPFHLSLRLWDVYMLEGDRLLVAMSYCILKMHKRRLMKMQMEDMSELLQQKLEKDFMYEDDIVIEQLQICLEDLRKASMDLPPRPRPNVISNERPQLPFGLDIQPSVEQIIGRRTSESIDEHFKRNPRGGKAAYLRKKNLNNLGTPELSRSRGDTRSLQSSRLSDYSIDDRSSYYDTAANSRLSLADQSRASIPSSRTSFSDTSDMGSMTLTYGGVPGFPEDIGEVNGTEVTTPTTPTPGGITTPTPMTASSTFHQDGGREVMESEPGAHSPGSINSDYDNLNGNYDESPAILINTPIPISKSDSFMDGRTATFQSEMVVSNGHDGPVTSRLKTTRTENDIQQARAFDATESSEREFQNGMVVERYTSHQVASSTTTHTRTVHTRQVERSAFM